MRSESCNTRLNKKHSQTENTERHRQTYITRCESRFDWLNKATFGGSVIIINQRMIVFRYHIPWEEPLAWQCKHLASNSTNQNKIKGKSGTSTSTTYFYSRSKNKPTNTKRLFQDLSCPLPTFPIFICHCEPELKHLFDQSSPQKVGYLHFKLHDVKNIQ